MSSLREDILERINIVDLVERYVDLKKVGKNWTGLCPFHKEKTPSFTVSEDKQIFKCFGCGKGGNAITFHMEIERLDFWDTMQELAKMTNTDISKYSHDPEKVKAKKSEKEKFKVLNKRLQSVFSHNFEDSIAQEYATKKRKLTEKTIKTFGLGYAPDSHYKYINILKDKGFEDEDLIKGGVAKRGSSGDLYAFFRNRLTFPIHNHIGTVVGFGARALEEEQNPKYLNTTETPLYDKSRILYGLDKAKKHVNQLGALIIVEGYMDVIAMYQYGLPIGIATCGTALTQEHIKLIKRNSENIIFAFDSDEAGFKATLRGLRIAYQQELFPKILQLPNNYKDIDEYLTESGEKVTMEDIEKLCTDGFTAVLERLKKMYDLDNPVLRKKYTATIFELLRGIQDYGIFMMYIERLAKQLSSSPQALVKQFKQHISSKRIPKYQQDEESSEKSSKDISITLGAILYDNFLNEQEIIEEKVQPLQEKIEKIIGMLEAHPLQKVLKNDISEETKQKLLEQQLAREQQRSETNRQKTTLSIQQFLQKSLHQLKRAAMKHPRLSKEQKNELMQL